MQPPSLWNVVEKPSAYKALLFMEKSIYDLKAEFNTLLKNSNERYKIQRGLEKVGVRRTTQTKGERNGFIYFIQDSFTELIKIGWAVDPDCRLSQLQTGSAGKLVLLGAFEGTVKNEKELHRLMFGEHVRGEWFENNDNIKMYIKEKNTYKIRQ